MKTLKEIEERLQQIANQISDEEKRSLISTDDLKAINIEVEILNEEKRQALELIETRQKEIDAASKFAETIKERKEETKPMDFTKENVLKSPEYRSAFFKKLADEALTEAEERAYTTTTSNFGGALPIETLNEIWSNIEEEHPILGDISLYRSGTVLEVSVHNSITAGDAAVKAQGVANDDEENAWIKVTLSGKDFTKHVEVSYALGKMTAGALENYLKGEIAQRLGAAMAADIIAQITTDTAAGNKKNSAGVKVTTYAELNSIFALVKAKGLAVYANQTTVYNYLTSIVDTTGRPVFQPSAQAGVAGFLIGAPVKIEDACVDNLFYVGSPKKVIGNMVQDVMIETQRDIKRHVDIHAGYARFECKLTKSTAFAILTVKQA